MGSQRVQPRLGIHGKRQGLSLYRQGIHLDSPEPDHRWSLYRIGIGQSFDELDVPNQFSWIKDIEVAANDEDHVYLTLSNYNDSTKVLESLDGGLSWTNDSHGLPSAPVNCIAIDVDGNGLNYVGTDVGVYRKDATQGSEWVRQSEGLPNEVV